MNWLIENTTQKQEEEFFSKDFGVAIRTFPSGNRPVLKFPKNTQLNTPTSLILIPSYDSQPVPIHSGMMFPTKLQEQIMAISILNCM